MVVLGRSTDAVLLIMLYLNVHSLLPVKKRTNQEKRHRQAASCPALCRFGGSFEVRLRLTSALYPPALDSRVLSAEPARLKPALLRMPVKVKTSGPYVLRCLGLWRTEPQILDHLCLTVRRDSAMRAYWAGVLNRLFRVFYGA